MRKLLPRVSLPMAMLLLVLAVMAGGNVWAAPGQDYLVFCQEDGGRQTVYLMAEQGTDLQTVASGADLNVFFLPRHLVYSTGDRLFEYDLNGMKVKPLAQLDPQETLNQVLSYQVLSYDSPGPDQAFVITTDVLGNIHQYVMEFSDGSLRRIGGPGNNAETGSGGSSRQPEVVSPDGAASVTVRRIPFSQRLEIRLVPKQTGSGLKNIKKWTLPSQYTAFPEFPIWSPDSRWFAFYACRSDQLAGFYDLYLFDRESSRMILVQAQVFNRLPFEDPVMGEFTPSWSPDSRYLAYEYQPYGLPTVSAIWLYEAGSGKKLAITDGPGQRQAPVWSPSGQKLSFIMNISGSGPQVYWINPDGTAERKISPNGGTTAWAEWYQPNLE